METREAFDTLLKAVTAELEKVQQEGAAYFAVGDTPHVREAADRVERIQTVISAVGKLKDLWGEAIPFDEPLYPLAQNDNQPHRTPSGIRTSQDLYWLPILQTLSDMGGKGHTYSVLDQVGNFMADILNDFDRDNLPTRDEPRWRNTASWARSDMVKAKYLSDRSPNGIWEITEEGRKFLKNRTGN